MKRPLCAAVADSLNQILQFNGLSEMQIEPCLAGFLPVRFLADIPLSVEHTRRACRWIEHQTRRDRFVTGPRRRHHAGARYRCRADAADRRLLRGSAVGPVTTLFSWAVEVAGTAGSATSAPSYTSPATVDDTRTSPAGSGRRMNGRAAQPPAGPSIRFCTITVPCGNPGSGRLHSTGDSETIRELAFWRARC